MGFTTKLPTDALSHAGPLFPKRALISGYRGFLWLGFSQSKYIAYAYVRDFEWGCGFPGWIFFIIVTSICLGFLFVCGGIFDYYNWTLVQWGSPMDVRGSLLDDVLCEKEYAWSLWRKSELFETGIRNTEFNLCKSDVSVVARADLPQNKHFYNGEPKIEGLLKLCFLQLRWLNPRGRDEISLNSQMIVCLLYWATYMWYW